jgi:AmmeMemoRadiSam system protein B
MVTVREPIVEGIFYPSDRTKLKKLVTTLLENSVANGGNAFGIISPHAGYRYSGAIAASAFKAAQGRSLRTVVILAPIHRTEKEEVIFPESDKFKMPAGLIPVDGEAVEELLSCSTMFLKDDIPHLAEHSIEVQLPFLPVLFPHCAIVPVLVGKISPQTIIALSRALAHVFENRFDSTLFIVSANLTSFMQGPAAKAEADTMLRLILSHDTDGLLSAMETGKISSSGAPAVAALMLVAGKACEIRLLSSGSSAQINRDFKELVHYAAIGFFNPKE